MSGEFKSRSVMRREALMRGEPMPTFSSEEQPMSDWRVKVDVGALDESLSDEEQAIELLSRYQFANDGKCVCCFNGKTVHDCELSRLLARSIYGKQSVKARLKP